MSALAHPPAPAVTPHAGPRPWRWNLEQYRALGAAHLFDNVKTLLLDGVIYAVPHPNPPHNTALGLAAEYLRTWCPPGHHVRNQMAFDVGTQDDPGPDLAVVAGSIRDYANRQATAALLIVEVSDSSLFLDTTTKAELYATAGVPEYWVVDLDNRQLIVFRDPESLPKGLGATAYRSRQAFGPADTVSPLAAPAATVRVAELLP